MMHCHFAVQDPKRMLRLANPTTRASTSESDESEASSSHPPPYCTHRPTSSIASPATSRSHHDVGTAASINGVTAPPSHRETIAQIPDVVSTPSVGRSGHTIALARSARSSSQGVQAAAPAPRIRPTPMPIGGRHRPNTSTAIAVTTLPPVQESVAMSTPTPAGSGPGSFIAAVTSTPRSTSTPTLNGSRTLQTTVPGVKARPLQSYLEAKMSFRLLASLSWPLSKVS
ncbi:hypothetical protein B0H12DRAFT_539121 [Mycena haematopus]|nr:hypothetical protein B0H12DRAFT_539121 [Mycena haematopus]